MQYFRFAALSSKDLALSPGIARTPHHAREARASNHRRDFRDDYAEGLGRYPTGFLRDQREEEV
jgi:hypothetical protein